jgi:hypothetical protein
VTVFSDGDGSIDSRAEFDEIVSLPGAAVKVVNQITFCGKFGSFAGCAPQPGHAFVVASLVPDVAGRVWAHEYGHTRGLPHRQVRTAVMRQGPIATATGVNADECDAFWSTMPMVSGTLPWDQPASADAAGDIASFVRGRYVHGVPFAEVKRYAAAPATAVLLRMLDTPAEEEAWPNIVVTLGMLGDATAVHPLIAFLERGVGRRLSHSHYIAKSLVPMALGLNANQSGSQEALAYLTASLASDVWTERSLRWSSPFHATAAARNLDLSKKAIIGLALSGNPDAGGALRALRGAVPLRHRRLQATARAVLPDAIRAHGEILRGGLASYYRDPD